jgi:hypothetical protein
MIVTIAVHAAFACDTESNGPGAIRFVMTARHENRRAAVSLAFAVACRMRMHHPFGIISVQKRMKYI